jgi:hypothetical protein
VFCVVIKQAPDIFGRWMKWQQIVSDKNISDLSNRIDDNYLSIFKSYYETNFSKLEPFSLFLSNITNGCISPQGYNIKEPLDEKFKENLKEIYKSLDTNISEFIEFFTRNKFDNIFSSDEKTKENLEKTINDYKTLFWLLLSLNNKIIENQYLFAIANRFFEFCFSSQTFGDYLRYVGQVKYHSVLKFINAVLWFHLVGEGWKHWHKNCIEALKDRAKQGDEIVYIAGGTDIYQLIKQGIYNIRIIDPFLPTQESYYCEEWEWLLCSDDGNNGIGDKIFFNFDTYSVYMTRILYSEGEKFFTRHSSGKLQEIKNSITQWKVFSEDDKYLGTITLERRLAQQSDFVQTNGKIIVMSYDELISAVIPEYMNGWGISPLKIPESSIFFVKQLRKPVTKSELIASRLVFVLVSTDLNFIRLTSDPS